MRGLWKTLAMPFAGRTASAGEGGRQRQRPLNGEHPRARAFPAWRVLLETYPRLAAGMALATAFLFLFHSVQIYQLIRYGRELAGMSVSAAQAELERVAAVEAAQRNIAALSVELTRRAARRDRNLHLAVDRARGVMYLEREGAVLREMPVLLGPEKTAGSAADSPRPAPATGRRLVATVADQNYRWRVPAWVFSQRGQPVPQDRVLPGTLGPLAVILDCGAVIYAQPGSGLLNDANYVLPGSVRAAAADMEAIRMNLRPGIAVYFY